MSCYNRILRFLTCCAFYSHLVWDILKFSCGLSFDPWVILKCIAKSPKFGDFWDILVWLISHLILSWSYNIFYVISVLWTWLKLVLWPIHMICLNIPCVCEKNIYFAVLGGVLWISFRLNWWLVFTYYIFFQIS